MPRAVDAGFDPSMSTVGSARDGDDSGMGLLLCGGDGFGIGIARAVPLGQWYFSFALARAVPSARTRRRGAPADAVHSLPVDGSSYTDG